MKNLYVFRLVLVGVLFCLITVAVSGAILITPRATSPPTTVAIWSDVPEVRPFTDVPLVRPFKPKPVVTRAKVGVVKPKAVVKPKVVEKPRVATKKTRVFYTTVTAYCACSKCTGKSPGDPAYGITATGARARANHTIATDWNYLPRGTRLKIKGFGDTIFVVEDTFGKVNKGYRIDIYFDSHQRAIEYGRRREVQVQYVD